MKDHRGPKERAGDDEAIERNPYADCVAWWDARDAFESQIAELRREHESEIRDIAARERQRFEEVTSRLKMEIEATARQLSEVSSTVDGRLSEQLASISDQLQVRIQDYQQRLDRLLSHDTTAKLEELELRIAKLEGDRRTPASMRPSTPPDERPARGAASSAEPAPGVIYKHERPTSRDPSARAERGGSPRRGWRRATIAAIAVLLVLAGVFVFYYGGTPKGPGTRPDTLAPPLANSGPALVSVEALRDQVMEHLSDRALAARALGHLADHGMSAEARAFHIRLWAGEDVDRQSRIRTLLSQFLVGSEAPIRVDGRWGDGSTAVLKQVLSKDETTLSARCCQDRNGPDLRDCFLGSQLFEVGDCNAVTATVSRLGQPSYAKHIVEELLKVGSSDQLTSVGLPLSDFEPRAWSRSPTEDERRELVNLLVPPGGGEEAQRSSLEEANRILTGRSGGAS